jgi:hypothetical protein
MYVSFPLCLKNSLTSHLTATATTVRSILMDLYYMTNPQPSDRCVYDDDMVSALKYAYAQGNQIASHTWRHANLSTLTSDQVHNEMWKVESMPLHIFSAELS